MCVNSRDNDELGDSFVKSTMSSVTPTLGSSTNNDYTTDENICDEPDETIDDILCNVLMYGVTDNESSEGNDEEF